MLLGIKFDPKKDIQRIIVITFAALLVALNLKSFVGTGGIYPGGVSGVAILIQRIAETFFHVKLSYTLINLLLNAGPVYIGFRYIGKKFTLLSFYFIFISSIITDLIPKITITQDILLISIFGGIINGIAIGLCLLMNATTGGTDFIGIFLSERLGVDSFNMILGLNAVILCIAGFLFGWDKALYSILFQYASTEVLHHIYRKFQQGTLFVVTDQADLIADTISEMTMHSSTILKGEGAYKHRERSLVYSVISAAEANDVMKKLREVDPKAFINMIHTEKMSGRFYYRKEE